MAKRIPTVEVVNPNAPDETMIINKSAYDADPERYEVADGASGDGEQDPSTALTKTNVSDLPAALAEEEDAEVIRAAAEADSRSTAAEHYEDRIAELEEADEDEEAEGEEGGE